MNAPMNRGQLAAQATNPAALRSQATTIEQSRAVAQVQGALVVAQQRPRDEIVAMTRIRESCAVPELAKRAFFSFPRGRERVTGSSIHLATELARCWGNVDFGIVELSRGEAESEMQAFAWDLERNVRITNSFIVPHARDTQQGVKALTDMRDIYENNANLGARRLRECIFRVIPPHVRSEAEDICRGTLERGDGTPLPQRREKMLEAFSAISVTRLQVERRIGNSADRLTPVDLANLQIIYQSIRRGETTKESEFPPLEAETAKEAIQQSKPALPPKESRPPNSETLGDMLDGPAVDAAIADFAKARSMPELDDAKRAHTPLWERLNGEPLARLNNAYDEHAVRIAKVRR